MKTIGYFHTAGYTESGSLPSFLKKVNSNVNWERCFPAYEKIKIMKGRHGSTPVKQYRSQESGITGEALIEKMKTIMTRYKQDYQHLDWVVLIDDLDCAPSQAVSVLEQEVSQILDKSIQLLILYASPEVEAWFVADWDHSFGKRYPRAIADQLRHGLSRHTPPVNRNSIEIFGRPMKALGGCTTKLSEVIQTVFSGEITSSVPYEYSKRYDGNEMLSNIEPEVVAEVCNVHFFPVYRKLREIERSN